MKITILTLFPEMFRGPFESSIIKRARENGFVEINIHNLRDWAKDSHKTVDDKPYGGGPGMIMRVDIIDSAVMDLNKKSKVKSKKSKVILLSANGKTYDQKTAKKLSRLDSIILIAGHYEGVDHRVDEHIADEVISIGNYVLTGGEIPAMVVVDSVIRLIPGVLNPESLKHESFSSLEIRNSKLELSKEYPQYTRPENYKGWKVPEVLLSGHHKKIMSWREKKTKV